MTGIMKLEAIVLPVADVDRAFAFYSKLEWRIDADIPNPFVPIFPLCTVDQSAIPGR